MKPALTVSIAILVAAIIGASICKTGSCDVHLDARLQEPQSSFDGDMSPHRTYPYVVIHEKARVVNLIAGQGEYEQYGGFYPMLTSSGMIKINMVKAGQGMNDNNIDHILTSQPVEFRGQQVHGGATQELAPGTAP